MRASPAASPLLSAGVMRRTLTRRPSRSSALKPRVSGRLDMLVPVSVPMTTPFAPDRRRAPPERLNSGRQEETRGGWRLAVRRALLGRVSGMTPGTDVTQALIDLSGGYPNA